jgi:hypothetical protein
LDSGLEFKDLLVNQESMHILCPVYYELE